MGKKQNKTGGLRKQWTRIHSSELTNNLRVLNISIFNHSAMEDGGEGGGVASGSPLKCEDNHVGHFDIVRAEPWTFDFITELSHLLQKQTFSRATHYKYFAVDRGAYACQPTITHSPHKQVWQLQKIKLFFF